jgi:hypothetical protein
MIDFLLQPLSLSRLTLYASPSEGPGTMRLITTTQKLAYAASHSSDHLRSADLLLFSLVLSTLFFFFITSFLISHFFVSHIDGARVLGESGSGPEPENIATYLYELSVVSSLFGVECAGVDGSSSVGNFPKIVKSKIATFLSFILRKGDDLGCDVNTVQRFGHR